MKKIMYILICLVFSVMLCSCDPGTNVIVDDELDGIKSIELIRYNNPKQKQFTSWVPNHFDELKPFKLNNYLLLENLEENKIDSFLKSFKSKDILNTYYAYDSPNDICIKLNYDTGNFLIIWANYKIGSFIGYIGEYLPDGSVLSFWGCFSSLDYYEELVSNYFVTELK